MAKTGTNKVYTVTGFARIGGCIETSVYTELFTTRDEAADFVASEINQYIVQEGIQKEHVSAEDCRNGYRIYAGNDADDMLDLSIVEHRIGPVHAVVTFDQNDRTLNITTVKDRDAAYARVAKCAKDYLAYSGNYPEYVNVDRDGNCDIEADELTDSEPYVQVETTGGNFTAWTAVEIPVFGKADIDVQ